jgi:LysM repeat protein
MKKLKTTLPIESLIKSAKSQALIEGELQKKSSQPEISQILLVNGRNIITAIDIMDDQVFLEGKTFFNVVYSDMIGELYSFESSASFKHTIEVPGAKSGYKGYAACSTKDINYRLLPSGIVAVKAYAEITCNVWTQITQDILTEVTSDPNTYVKEEAISIPVQTAFKNTLVTVRDEIRVPQNMPTINKILDISGYAMVKNINVENMKVVAEGDIRVSVIYESKDKNAPLQHMTSTLPFGEIIGIDEAEENDLASIFTEIMDLAASPYEGSEDIFAVDISFKLVTSLYSYKKINVIGDLYSTATKIDCSREKLMMRGLRNYNSTKCILRSGIELPKNAPDVTRVLFCRTNPCISKATAMHGFVEVEGVLYTQIGYSIASGQIHSAAIETPFKTEISVECAHPGMDVMARGNIEYFEVEGSGRDLDAKFSIEIALACYTSQGRDVVLDAVESPEKVETEKGILVYFAQSGETAWDICKKFHITPDTLESLNKHTNITSIQPGSKLIIFT